MVSHPPLRRLKPHRHWPHTGCWGREGAASRSVTLWEAQAKGSDESLDSTIVLLEQEGNGARFEHLLSLRLTQSTRQCEDIPADRLTA